MGETAIAMNSSPALEPVPGCKLDGDAGAAEARPGCWLVSSVRQGIRGGGTWRRERDSNPRYHVLVVHAISSRAPSASSDISPRDHAPGGRLEPPAPRWAAHRNGCAPNFGGEGGIRTHVPRSSRDKSISSRPRYDHFGTSPVSDRLGIFPRRIRKNSRIRRRQPSSLTPVISSTW